MQEIGLVMTVHLETCCLTYRKQTVYSVYLWIWPTLQPTSDVIDLKINKCIER
jgi:hypothetical protein